MLIPYFSTKNPFIFVSSRPLNAHRTYVFNSVDPGYRNFNFTTTKTLFPLFCPAYKVRTMFKYFPFKYATTV